MKHVAEAQESSAKTPVAAQGDAAKEQDTVPQEAPANAQDDAMAQGTIGSRYERRSVMTVKSECTFTSSRPGR